jgi:hypothetical protein
MIPSDSALNSSSPTKLSRLSQGSVNSAPSFRRLTRTVEGTRSTSDPESPLIAILKIGGSISCDSIPSITTTPPEDEPRSRGLSSRIPLPMPLSLPPPPLPIPLISRSRRSATSSPRQQSPRKEGSHNPTLAREEMRQDVLKLVRGHVTRYPFSEQFDEILRSENERYCNQKMREALENGRPIGEFAAASLVNAGNASLTLPTRRKRSNSDTRPRKMLPSGFLSNSASTNRDVIARNGKGARAKDDAHLPM